MSVSWVQNGCLKRPRPPRPVPWPSRRGALSGGPRCGEAAAGDGHRSRDAAAAAAAARTGDVGFGTGGRYQDIQSGYLT